MVTAIVFILFIGLVACIISITTELLLPILAAVALYILLKFVIGLFDDKTANVMFDGVIGICIFILILWLIW